MKSNKALQKIKLLQARILTMIKASPKQVTECQSDTPHERPEFAFDTPQSMA
jgi:hypothetical protein